MHIEDQVGAKRCGHRPDKEIVTTEEMVDRVKAAADAKIDPDFFLIARTDAIQAFGVDAAIERAIAKGVNQVAFDRSGFRFHGRVKALADAAREAGLEF